MKITLGNTLPPYPAFVGCTPSDTDKTLPRISFLFIFVLCLVRISVQRMIIFIKWATNKWKLDFLIEFSIYLCSVFPPDARENRKLDYNEIENER